MPAFFDSGLFVNTGLNDEWHGLGMVVDEAPSTTLEALEFSGMDWDVLECPIVIPGHESTVTADFKSLVRSDNGYLLNVCRQTWTPIQNKDAFTWFDPLIEQGLVEITSAVSLNDGKRIAITAQILGDHSEGDVGDDDIITNNVLLYNSHDGSLCLGYKFTPIRVVCSNTLHMALSLDGKKNKEHKIRHTATIEQRMKAAQQLIDIQARTFNASIKEYRAMASKKISAKGFDQYLEGVFSASLAGKDVKGLKAYDTLVENFETGKGSDLTAANGTLWGAYNAITDWTSHTRGSQDIEGLRNRLNAIYFGTAEDINATAHSVALAMV